MPKFQMTPEARHERALKAAEARRKKHKAEPEGLKPEPEPEPVCAPDASTVYCCKCNSETIAPLYKPADRKHEYPHCYACALQPLTAERKRRIDRQLARQHRRTGWSAAF